MLSSFGFLSAGVDELCEVLERWFTPRMLSLIECAFEMDNGYGEVYSTLSDRDEAVEFGEDYEDDEERLRAIYQNIIDNAGTFRP